MLTVATVLAIASTLAGLAASGPPATCPNDCNGRGECLSTNASSGACRCDPGYIGRDCSVVQCCVDDDCYDRDPLTADLCDVASGWCAHPAEVGALRCYPVRARKGSPRFAKVDVQVADAIEAKNATLQKPALLCDFVGIDGEVPLNVSFGYQCLKLKDLKGQPKLAKFELNATTTLFGTQRLQALPGGKQLCLPTALLEPGTCPAGAAAVGTPDGTTCLPCSPGSYQPLPGGSACLACEPGTAAAEPGVERCRRCAPGFFANVSGASSCDPCTPGFFTNGTGAATCEPCPDGTVAALPGRSVCRSCPGGLQPSPDHTECVP